MLLFVGLHEMCIDNLEHGQSTYPVLVLDTGLTTPRRCAHVLNIAKPLIDNCTRGGHKALQARYISHSSAISSAHTTRSIVS